MGYNFPTACLAAAVVIGIPAIASAQEVSTDRNGYAMGSRHVSSGIIGSMRNGSHVPTEIWLAAHRPKRFDGKAAPQGDPSKNNDARK